MPVSTPTTSHHASGFTSGTPMSVGQSHGSCFSSSTPTTTRGTKSPGTTTARDEQGQDVETQVLHIDIYRDRSKYRSECAAPPISAGVALNRVEDLLKQNLEAYIER